MVWDPVPLWRFFSRGRGEFHRALVGGLLTALVAWTAGCTQPPCPPGSVRNSAGECVYVVALPGDREPDTIERDANPNGDIEPTPDSPDTATDGPDTGDIAPDGDSAEDDPTPTPCATDADCRFGRRCHIELGSGLCLPPCDDDAMCTALAALWDDWGAEHHPPDDGDANGDSLSEDSPSEAADNTEADIDEIADAAPPFFCNASRLCRRIPVLPGCRADGDCPRSERCHPQAGPQGRCAPLCAVDGDCARIVGGSGLACGGAGLCRPPPVGTGCRSLDDCSMGQVCHSRVGNGVCAPPCDADAPCRTLTPFGTCSADDTCRPDPDAHSCSGDGDCAAGRVCHSGVTVGGNPGLCAPRCPDDAFCRLLGADLRCNADNRCARLDSLGRCGTDAECPQGESCHLVGQLGPTTPGRCAPRCYDDGACVDRFAGDTGSAALFCNRHSACRLRTPGPCTSDADCSLFAVCHIDAGECRPPCLNDDQCRELREDLRCNGVRRCVSGGAAAECGADADCQVGEVCHRPHPDGTLPCLAFADGRGFCSPPCTSDATCGPARCNAPGRCRCPRIVPGCAAETDCPVNTVCHPLGEAGTCAARCSTNVDCAALGPGLVCDASRRCVRDQRQRPCMADGDCDRGQLCHTRLQPGLCGGACTRDSECRPLVEAAWCAFDGRCSPAPKGSGTCGLDADCAFGEVCHAQLPPDGVCAAACRSDDLCRQISLNPQAFCNAERRCVVPDPSPGDNGDGTEGSEENPEGDLDGPDAEPDRDVDLDGDGPPPCADVRSLGRYTINIDTLRLTLRLTERGQSYADPQGRTQVYLQDAASGARFTLFSNVADGASLGPVRVPKGRYHVIVANAWGQQQRALEDVNLAVPGTSELTVEVPVPLIRLTVTLKLDGAEFPTFDTAARGRMLAYDNVLRREFPLFETGGGTQGATVSLFPSTLDLIFDGHLTADGRSPQRVTLVNDRSVAADTTIALDLPTVRIFGEIQRNGSVWPDLDPLSALPGTTHRGRIVGLAQPIGDRFTLLELGREGPPRYDRRVYAGTYDFAYQPGESDINNDESYDFLQPLGRRSLSADATVNWDVRLTPIRGTISRAGAPWPDAAHLERGRVEIVDPQQGRRLIAVLGKSGIPSFSAEVAPGTYRVEFRGPLLDTRYFIDRAWPRFRRRVTLTTDWTIPAQAGVLRRDFDVPLRPVSGRILLNGRPVSGIDRRGQFLTLRAQGDGEDIAAVDFDAFGGPDYTTMAVPGRYDIRHQGQVFTPVLAYFFLARELEIPAEPAGQPFNLTLDVRVDAVTVAVRVNGSPLDLLIADRIFTGAEAHAQDLDIRNRMRAAQSVAEGGMMALQLPRARYDLILRTLGEGASFQEFAIAKELAPTGVTPVSASVNLVPFRLAFTIDGRPLSDAAFADEQSRGDVLFRKTDDYDNHADADLLPAGAVDRPMMLPPGRYNVNFASGYATQILPRNIWMSVGCLQVSE